MDSTVTTLVDGGQLRVELQQLEQQAMRMERLAVAAIHVADVNGRERTFAATLLRNAKGARLAAAAWSQEVKNR